MINSPRLATTDKRYYTYLHRRNDTRQVFYVGKGCGARAFDAASYNRSQYWLRVYEKCGRTVEIVSFWEDEESAYAHEVLLIKCFKQLNHPLVNATDGGDGFNGFVRTSEQNERGQAAANAAKRTERARAKMSHSAKERWVNQTERNELSIKIKKVMQQPEIRLKYEQNLAAKADLQKANLRKAKSKKFRCVETGQIFCILQEAQDWLRSIGHTRARFTGVHLVLNGKAATSYGYHWEYLKEQNVVIIAG